MNFVARIVQRKRQEQRMNLCVAFIDLWKASDTVNRDAVGFYETMRVLQQVNERMRVFHANITAAGVVGS